jgi:hypothetical protein
MSTRRVVLAALLVLPLALVGCKIDTINYFPPKAAHVRMVNVVADAPLLDVTVDGNPAFTGVAFEGSTDFVDFDNKEQTFSVRIRGATSPLVEQSFSLAGEQTYTLIAFGTNRIPLLLLLPDATIEPGSGRSQLRIANVAPGIDAFDVYVTAPGVAIDELFPNFGSLGYGSATTYLQFGSGTYQVRMTTTGTKTIIYDSGPHEFSSSTSTDLIAYSRTSGRLPNVLMLDVNGAGQRVVANNTLAAAKFVHAAPQAGNVNVLVDGTATFSNIAYPVATSYVTLATGTRTISFEATATPGVPIATASPSLGPAADYTVVATGLAGSTHTFVLADNNVPTQFGNTKVRLVNAAIGIGPVDVVINDVKQVSALAADSASPYLEIASGTYTIAFVDTATGTVVASTSGASLSDSSTNTVFLAGTAGALSILLSQDD